MTSLISNAVRTKTSQVRSARLDSDHFLNLATSKIQPQHLDRLAVVYVRQSSPRQVTENRESRELQYSLSRRAVAYGWHEDRVLIIDDDQGQSGRTAENRMGFQRLLAEVGLNHVGLVLGIEMSRLARSCKDWYQLLELCAVFSALLADQDGLYDPSNYNDRLLLGLKGTMSEAELHILRCRMEQGKRNKAERGELFERLPMGYVFGPSREVLLDPDEQTRSLVRLIFEKFDELGTGRGVLMYFKRHKIRLPFHIYAGPNKGQIEWRLPSASTIYGMLKHPIYAGAYARGRRRVDPRRRVVGQPHSGRISMARDQWDVLIQDRLPAYITWDKYLANQEILAENVPRPNTRGPVREGPTLLGGLVKCGRCGWRMRVHYHATGGSATYHCPSQEKEGDHSLCQDVNSLVLDELVSQLVLKAVEPASLTLSLQASEDIESERQRLHQQGQQQLERAKYHTQRAKRQYDAVEPENRLVARELERQWEGALCEERTLQDKYDRLRVDQPPQLSPDERQRIEALAQELPRLWADDRTSPADRQAVIRCLVEQVVVTLQGETECADVAIHWAGGFVSHHETLRPVSRYDMLRDYDRLKQRITELRQNGKTASEVADTLNKEGFYPPRLRNEFNAVMVRMLAKRLGLNGPRADSLAHEHLRGPSEWWIRDLCHKLRIPQSVMSKWCCRGWVHARKVMITRFRWIVWADDQEQDRLRRLHAHRRTGPDRCFPRELTTPKKRDDA